MEGSKSEAVFDSMNLNPQLFINATINTVDDVVDEAFDFFTWLFSFSLSLQCKLFSLIEGFGSSILQ